MRQRKGKQHELPSREARLTIYTYFAEKVRDNADTEVGCGKHAPLRHATCILRLDVSMFWRTRAVTAVLSSVETYHAQT